MYSLWKAGKGSRSRGYTHRIQFNEARKGHYHWIFCIKQWQFRLVICPCCMFFCLHCFSCFLFPLFFFTGNSVSHFEGQVLSTSAGIFPSLFGSTSFWLLMSFPVSLDISWVLDLLLLSMSFCFLVQLPLTLGNKPFTFYSANKITWHNVGLLIILTWKCLSVHISANRC